MYRCVEECFRYREGIFLLQPFCWFLSKELLLTTGEAASAHWSRPSVSGTSPLSRPSSSAVDFRSVKPKPAHQVFPSIPQASMRAGVHLSKVAAGFQRKRLAVRVCARAPQHWEVVWRSGRGRVLPFRSSAPYFGDQRRKVSYKTANWRKKGGPNEEQLPWGRQSAVLSI